MEPQDQPDNTPDAGFRPAENPFANQAAQNPPPLSTTPTPAINPLTNQVAQSSSAVKSMLAEQPIQTQAAPINTPPVTDKSNLVGIRADTKRETDDEIPEQKEPEEILYEWQAPEFAYTHKPAGWYLAVFAFFAALMVLAFFFVGSDIQKWTTIGLLAVMAVAVSIWANRKPAVLQYRITTYGLEVGKRKHLFDDFRAFYEYMDYNQPSIDLVPGKRFGTLVSLPLATNEADQIEETISHMIPKIEHSEDIIDKLFRRLRF